MALNWTPKSTPFNFGITTSEIRKSGHWASADRNASIGSVKAVAEKPEEFKINASVEAMVGSSSTTKILGLRFTGIHIPLNGHHFGLKGILHTSSPRPSGLCIISN
jgi:hypothetical protein